MSDTYILSGKASVDGNPVAVDHIRWSLWIENNRNDRVVRATLIKPDGHDTFDGEVIENTGIWVSTVFLGLDHAFFGGPPVLWESMAFSEGNGLDYSQQRYTSLEDAKRGHQQMVDDLCDYLRKGKPIKDFGRDEQEAQ